MTKNTPDWKTIAVELKDDYRGNTEVSVSPLNYEAHFDSLEVGLLKHNATEKK